MTDRRHVGARSSVRVVAVRTRRQESRIGKVDSLCRLKQTSTLTFERLTVEAVQRFQPAKGATAASCVTRP